MRYKFEKIDAFNGFMNSGKSVHLVETEKRIDLEDGSELLMTWTICGVESRSSSHYKTNHELSCKRCIKKLKKGV